MSIPTPMLLCVLPAERASLCAAVEAAGGVPVVDLTCAQVVPEIPAGAWVRVRPGGPKVDGEVPGTGPVIRAGGGAPVPGRPTWVELTDVGPVPPGFAGMVLRGLEAGGPCGVRGGLELLAEVPADEPVILDAGLDPDGVAAAAAAGVAGVVLSDVLLGLPELFLPAALQDRLERAGPGTSHVINGLRIEAAPLAPVVRKLLGGAAFWPLCQDWFGAADPAHVAWPAGEALRKARGLAAAHRDLPGLLAACRDAVDRGASTTVVRPVSDAGGLGRADRAVAVIGMGCRLPDAKDLDAYWQLIEEGRSAIREVPPTRWDPALYWDADPAVPDKTYARIGAFLDDSPFEPRRFRIPPRVAHSLDPVQQIALESVADAIEDAGYLAVKGGEGRDFDRTRCAVILGNSMGGETENDTNLRVRTPALVKALLELPEVQALPRPQQEALAAAYERHLKDGLPGIDEDTMPGELANVIAGRVANAFDLSGPNFTVDAACASSMAAIQAAVKSLLDGESDMVVTGGVDRSMDVATYVKFSKIGALSPDHSAPFDDSANGFVMGEGAGILLLKRLEDAQRDGDRVYAVIRGVGASSDGRGKGITAPNPRGQVLALRRAWDQAGIDPVEADLIECHGTSTVVGDKVEVECLSQVIGAGRRGDRGPVRIGSVKSNIGHLKSAAGAAACIKTALALHKGVLPPSVGVAHPRQDLPMDQVPLQVQTRAEPWPADRPRVAGVSAFGFGGTNFHVVMTGAPGPSVEPRVAETADLPPGLWAASADSRAQLVEKLERGVIGAFEPAAPVRLVASAGDRKEQSEQASRAADMLGRGKDPSLLRGRGVHVEEGPVDGKVAFMFTGQGSQYIDMALQLRAMYPVVDETFRVADEVLTPLLGRSLTSFIARDEGIRLSDQQDALRATEISQPATLVVDIAILRLLVAHGLLPDMVAGHSLGEYAACVAAGVLSFEDALHATSARGREMAHIRLDDPGRMAGIATGLERVESVLAGVEGYVVAANKNCPTQTVIAGASDAVGQAVAVFREQGVTVYDIPVSHAFHSEIVAPASEPLQAILAGLDVRPPVRPITTNVDGGWYPTVESHGADGARAAIIEMLARQVAAPVEWTAQIERMYGAGARVFVEVGPKRALSGFVASILRGRPHRAISTNHPKRGDLGSLRDALASLTALGLPVRSVPAPGVPDLFAASEPRRATTAAIEARRLRAERAREERSGLAGDIIAAVAEAGGYSPDEIHLSDDLQADLGIDSIKQAELAATMRDRMGLDHDPDFRVSQYRTVRDLVNTIAQRVTGPPRPRAVTTTAPPATPVPTVPSRTAPAAPAAPAPSAVGTDTADALAAVARGVAQAGLDGAASHDVARAVLPAVQDLVAALTRAMPRPAAPAAAPSAAAPAAAPSAAAPAAAAPPPPSAQQSSPPTSLYATAVLEPAVEIVCSGASLGLPGGDEVFADDNIARILAGENRIQQLGEQRQDRFLDKHIVRLQKDARTGRGDFVSVETRDQVIRLAGIKGKLDVVSDYGIDPGLDRALDVTTRLAFAAGIEALRDAGIPLVRTFRDTTTGRKVATGWALPEPLRDDTGIVFGSAFPGYANLVEHLQRGGDDGEGRFDRRFLFQILAMGHSQFAQLIGARGPNTQINAACASTTQALCIAADWIRTGRARRVIVLGADDATGDQLLEWIGAGFLAAGAATTEDRVEEAALPFDERRHGMILGMGAVGLVLERAEDVANRGMAPVAKLLADRLANSAFHGTRLDAEHIASEVDALVGEAAAAAGVDRGTFARQSLFMSHETYTPAKGGSAAAEIDALRRAFGAAASKVVVTNTKGFTGHAMGAGLEDTVALKALQYSTVPPVPNLQRPDPALGDLTLSRGGRFGGRFALRLAAGFGSQVALTAWEKVADGDRRVLDDARHRAWLQRVGGVDTPRLVVEDRSLRLVEGRPEIVDDDHSPVAAPAVMAPPQLIEDVPPLRVGDDDDGGTTLLPGQAPPAVGLDDALAELVALLAEKTGYDPAEIDPDYELEADLGIDTVKQAEVFSEVRERHGLERDESFVLADYPTVRALARWLVGQKGGEVTGDVLPVAVPHEDGTDAFLAAVDQAAEESSQSLQPVPAPPAEAAAPKAAAPKAAAKAEPKAAAKAAPKPAPSAADVDALLVELQAILAEKTGYDPSEIDPDYELEADLGIDTVKQAEVFSEVRERHGLERDEGFVLADYPTVRSLAGWLAGALGGGAATSSPAASSSPAAAPSPAAASSSPSATASTPDAGAILAELQDILAEKTGYDPGEIDPDFELEADLGIDTVKQAEVFSEVRERHGLERDEAFVLADYPTVRSLAGWLATAIASGGGAAAASVEAAAPEAAAPEAAAPEAAAPEAAAPEAAAPEAAAPEAAAPEAALDARGLPTSFRIRRPVTIVRSPWVTGSLRGRRVLVLGDGPLSRAVADEVVARGGRIADADPDAVIDVGDDIGGSFTLARSLAGSPPRDWLCITRLGATPDAALDLARAEGSRAGLAKALGREWADCAARVVDIAPSLDDYAAATLTTSELAGHDGSVEVFRDADARRVTTLATEPFPEQGAPLAVPADGRPLVIALTGGTRGITARVALALAARGPCKLALLARTAPGTEPLDVAAARAAAKAELEAAGERATPVAVDRRIAALRRAEEARQTVVELESLGAEVAFFAVDLADEDAVALALDRVRERWGEIHGCVHGAGVEESRPLAEKDDAAMHRVYDGKVLGGLALARHLDPDAWLVSMGSVAGRFGNVGQADYSAANEAMARICAVRPRSLHVCWTAWADTGMAARGGMTHLLTERGVELLPAEAGAELLVDMVAAGMTGEVVVAGRLGDMTVTPGHALLDRAEHVGDGVVAWRRLDPAVDIWLDDHAFREDLPVVPGVIGLELMAAAAALIRPGAAYKGARDVRFEHAIKLHRREPVDVVVEAEPLPHDGVGPFEVACTVATVRALRTGRTQHKVCFRAVVQLDRAPDSEPLPPAFFAQKGINRGAIYKRFFHGPSFQVLRDGGAVASSSLLADAMVEHAFIAGGLLSMPLVLEAAFQAAGLHRMAVDGQRALPLSLDQVTLVRPAGDGEPLSVMVQRRVGGDVGDAVVYDIDVDGGDGAVLRVRGFRMVDTDPLDDPERFPEPEGGWPKSRIARATGKAVRVLTEADRARLSARGTERRVRDRLAGQAAAVLAVEALTGGRPTIERLDAGGPVVDGGPAVSISHGDGEGIAAACVGGPIGIDRERVEARGGAFARTWLTLGEQRAFAADPRAVTALWTVKEAVLKALGTGLRIDPRGVEVVALRPFRAEVRLHGAAAERAALLGGELFVSVAADPACSDHLIACALLHGAPLPVREAACPGASRSA